MANINDPELDIRAKDKTAQAFKSVQERLKNLASSVAAIQGPLGPIAGRINAVGAAFGRMNPIVLATTLGLAGFTAIEAKALAVGVKWQEEQDRLNSILNATGNVTGFTAKQLEELAQSFANATLASVSGTRDAIAALTNFRTISGDTFTTVLTLGEGMRRIFGGDLRGNVVKLARALDNPRQGLEGLSRNVLQSTAAWRDMVATMSESGNIVGAQKLILDKLTATIGNAAEGTGAAGALDSFGQAWETLLSNLAASDTLTTVVNKLTTVFNYLNKQINPTTLEQYTRAVELLQANFEKFEHPNIAEKALRGLGMAAGVTAKELEPLYAEVFRLAGALAKETDEQNKAKTAAEQNLRVQERQRMAEQRAKDTLKKKEILLKNSKNAWNLYFSSQAKAQTALAAWSTDNKELNVLLQQRNSILDDLTDAYIAAAHVGNLPAVEELQRLIDKIVEAHAKKRAEIEARYARQGVKYIGDTLGELAGYMEGASQRETDAINQHYNARADKVRETVNKGIITEEQGNRQLAGIEQRRQQELERTAKKNFDRSKKLRRAEAIIDTYASAVGAFKDTPGPVWVRAAAAAAAVAFGLARVAAINAQQYEGGAAIAGIGASGGLTTAQTAAPQQQAPGNVVNLIFAGSQTQPYTFSDKRSLIDFLVTAINERDLVIAQPGSRQVNDIIAEMQRRNS